MRFSRRFERDYGFYLRVMNIFNFDGNNHYLDKKGNNLIVHDIDGISAKEAFYLYDSDGKILPTSEPELLKNLFRTKASINLHIEMWAEGRADGTFPGIEFEEYAKEMKFPGWVIKAVEKQKKKLLFKIFPADLKFT